MESYATVEYADTYLACLLDTGAWDKADDATKERALMSATLQIDALASYSGGFRGQKADPDQPLEFPRSPDTVVPDAIKRACCLEALALLDQTQNTTASARAKAIQQGVTSVSIGDASESYAKSSEIRTGIKAYLLSDMAIALVRPYLALQGVYPIV